MNGSLRQTRRRFCARPQDRRGVLILVVLSLLIMFVVVAVMYVAVATRARSVATNYSGFERTGDTPEHITDSLARDLFRGSLNLHSPLRGTSLLEDIYGRSIRGTVAANPPPTAVPASTPQGQGTLIRFTAAAGLSPIEDHYGGCVLTLISGTNKGASFRILHSTETPAGSNSNVVQFTVMPIAAEQSQATAIPQNSVFVINGHPFAGTGIGFNAGHVQGGGPLDAMWQFTGSAQPVELPYALLPNPAFFEPRDYPAMQDQLDYLDPSGPGGANEDYDAPDFQNPHLAFFASISPQNMSHIKPSFHDPALLAYWSNWWTTRTPPLQASLFASNNPEPLGPILARKIMFRPNGYDHPQFVASGPRMRSPNPSRQSPVTLWENLEDGYWNIGPWDVDNDGDGIPDSIWIDPAYPVQVAKDGRTYKTLVSFLVLDLDGRLNLNAHGSSQTALQSGGSGGTMPFDRPIRLNEWFRNQTPVPLRYAGVADVQQDIPLSRGSGYGPADIRLDRFFSSIPNSSNALGDFLRLLNGDSNTSTPGRYGLDYFYEWDYTNPNNPQVGQRSLNMAPGYTGDDAASRIRQRDFPRNYAAVVSSHGSPSDLRGRVAFGLDVGGQPIFHSFTANIGRNTNDHASDWEYETVDEPYELNLNDVTGREGWTNYPTFAPAGAFGANYPFVPDNPFSIEEMERLLRPFDMDTASLPSRIVRLANSTATLRHALTTHSFDLPVLSPLPPAGIRGTLANNAPPVSQSIIDLMNAKVSTTVGMSITPQIVNNAIQDLLAPDLRRGLKMNINRPFGNGADDDNDGAIDDSDEADQQANYEAFSNNTPVTLDTAYGTGRDSRQLFAGHLYILMMLLADQDYYFMPFERELNGMLQDRQTVLLERYRAQRLAQWAVNVVDFRDHDNIMTRFQFDTKPFDAGGWEPNGQDGGVVYGCEMPTLLITETLAFHSRRVVDSKHDDGDPQNRGGKKRDEMAGDMMTPQDDDDDLDQALIPRGSAFIELLALFNPNQRQAQDLYVTSQNQTNPRATPVTALQIQKTTPGNWPVWRLAISEFHTEADDRITRTADDHMDTVSFDPSSPAPAPAKNFNLLRNHPHGHDVRIDRFVYFTNTPPPLERERSFHGVGQLTALQSGEYLVVGPGGLGAGRRVTQQMSGIPVGGRDFQGNKHAPSDQTLKALGPFSSRNTHSHQPPAPYSVYPSVQNQIRQVLILPVASSDQIRSAPINVNGQRSNWGDPNTDRVGLSISEPLFSNNYYPKPTVVNDGTGLPEAYAELDESDQNGKFLDEPLDSSTAPGVSMPLKATTAPTDFPPAALQNSEHNLLATATYPDVRTVFLQRLADPTRDHNQQDNPYITVDWLPFDLTVFNGEAKWDENQTDHGAEQWDPDDRDPNAEDSRGVNFISRQRGKITAREGGLVPGKNDYNIWTPISEHPWEVDPGWTTTGTGQAPTSMTTEHYFKHKLRHSLGFLNQSYGHPMRTQDVRSQGNQTTTDNAAQYRGWPKAHAAGQGKPFPWIKWNNRPFSSVHELLEVPASTPARLCFEFSYSNPAPLDPNVSPTSNSYDNLPNVQQRREFRHLLNFFHSRNDDGPIQPGASPDMYCVLDFLHVPSRFVGTETVLNPRVYSETDPMQGGDDTALFRPPFNLISNYRDPGRINLNTINDASVWKAVVPHKWDAMAPNAQGGQGDWVPEVTWQEFIESRRGDTETDLLKPASRGGIMPTIMRNPFRSGAAADFVPQTGNLAQLKHQGVNATILRAKGEQPDESPDPTNPNAPRVPLFGSTTSDTNTTDPLYTNNSRNSAFRYQNIERLSNLVTTRSNVYAVWVTVGYFEAVPNPGGIDAGHPDGYQIGAELGSDTGDVSRHRAFYIFDRSIPVGFERGMNHNIDRAIVLKRFIE